MFFCLSGHDMYEKYGGFDYVFEHYYKKIAHEYISPVAATADLVIVKGEDIATIIYTRGARTHAVTQ